MSIDKVEKKNCPAQSKPKKEVAEKNAIKSAGMSNKVINKKKKAVSESSTCGKNEEKMAEPEAQSLEQSIQLLRSSGYTVFRSADQLPKLDLGNMKKILSDIKESGIPVKVKIEEFKCHLEQERKTMMHCQGRIKKLKSLIDELSKRVKEKKHEKVSKAEQFVKEESNDEKSTKHKKSKKIKESKKSKKSVTSDNEEQDKKCQEESVTKISFAKYINKEEMLKILRNQDKDSPTYVKGHVRINPQNNLLAYISMDKENDVLVSGIENRNRAFEGDLVAAIINPEDDWTRHESGEIQKTASVVCILEKIHPRKIVGTLVLKKNKVKLISRDQRVPILYIKPKSVPEKVQAAPEKYVNTLFSAVISDWDRPHSCRGIIEKMIGETNDLEGETEALLLTNGLDVEPYGEELMEGLPRSDYVPSAKDLEGREDWRGECVFTIDPATAVDLDDAVSCKKLPNGNFKVGVHISDVTHYLKAFSPLDEEVSKRATTVYLVNAVHHMLPKSLCNVCSLLPGQKKLAFSVIWEMTPEAEVVSHRFAKTVIKSCYQMSYEQAQTMINETTGEWTALNLDDLSLDEPPKQIRKVVTDLYKLSSQLRERRFADGALSINQPKLQILLDQETKIPISYRIEERQESNRLIEEFMLLANMTVAKHLYENMGDTAFLRSHGEPLTRTLTRTAEDLARLGIILDIESAASLQASLELHEKSRLGGDDDDFATDCRMMVINCLVAQSMPRAKYLCSGKIEAEEDLRHFALNVPFYTHFTSPIRRYADIVVHRLLESSLTETAMPDAWSADLCAKFAANCNRKKYSAKIAQEQSHELYFMDLLSRKGPTETMATVMKVRKRHMHVILCHVGITIKISYSDLKDDADYEYNEELSVPAAIIKWKNPEFTQTINVFSIINVRVDKHPKFYAIRGVLLPTRLEALTDSV